MTEFVRTGESKRGQTRDNLRQHNLSTVLRMLHQAGTVSRSHLTSSTGLNRSTISDLVAELVQLGLVTESEGTIAGAIGRPSLLVSPSDDVVAFAVNPEIDATTVGLVTLSGKILAKVRYPTSVQPAPQEAAEIANKLIANMRAGLKPGTRIAGVGAAVPGQIRVADGVVRLAPALNWVEAPFGQLLSQLTGLDVHLDNDASLGCLAERSFGSARGAVHVVYLFAGSGGIGGGVIVDGKQLRGSAGYAGELGHIQVSSSATKDFSRLPGTLEALVRRDDLLEVFMLDSATDEELDHDIMASTDKKVIKVLHRQIDDLGRALGALANIFNPQVVVLAGFLDSLLRFDTERLLSMLRASSLNAAQESLVVRSAELGSKSLMVGAAELAFGNLLDHPSSADLYKVPQA